MFPNAINVGPEHFRNIQEKIVAQSVQLALPQHITEKKRVPSVRLEHSLPRKEVKVCTHVQIAHQVHISRTPGRRSAYTALLANINSMLVNQNATNEEQ